MRRLVAPLACVLGLCLMAPRARGGEAAELVAQDFREIIRNAKDRVFPALVYVKCIREARESGKRETQEVGGSGVLISPDGEFLTNWHVVDKAIQVRCLLHDGEALHAKVIGTDKDTDLALCRLQVPEGHAPFPYAVLGDSDDLVEGEFVMAMGAPWGLSRSVSLGILACRCRYLPENSEYSLWLQSDASISPGNSGGPLVSTRGEIVGINTLGVLFGGDMGFAVPSNTIRVVAAQLREHGKMRWSWTGIRLQPLRDFERDMVFEGDDGVVVADTEEDSPGREAGLRTHDRLLAVGGQPVVALSAEDLPAVRQALGLLPIGEPTRLRVRRGQEEIDVEIVPREKGRVEGEELDLPRWDLSLKAINRFDQPGLYFHRKEGVFVFGVRSPGNASQAGLRKFDILLAVDGKPVTTLDDVRGLHEETMQDVATRTRAVFTILRNGLMRQVVLDYARDYERR